MHRYKRTEAGVLPVEWEALPAREIGTVKGGSGFPLVLQGETSGEYPFFKVSDMNNEGNETFMTSANHYISEQTRKRLGATAFPAGGIVFAKVGAAVFLERKKILGQRSCIDNNMAAFVLDESRADVCFIHSVLLSKKLSALVATTALPALNGKQFGGMTLPLPPLAEQRAIATALSDMDALLAGLDRLIAKKRDLKQAAMQQLLTGQSRLPGFQGEWQERSLATVVADLTAGVSVNSVSGAGHHSLGEPGILKTSCVASGAFDPEEFKLIDQREIGRARLSPRQNTLIISRMNTPNLVGEVGFVDRDYPHLFLPDRLWMTRFRSDSGLCPKWLAYQMSSPVTQVAIKDLASGTSGSMKNISKSKLLALTLDFPPSDEQEAIAAVLSDMDAELDTLEARRSKTGALKQGMMQELLTGRIRLV